jgi:hypothetical protein
MSVKELTGLLRPADVEIARVAGALPYRDFMTVGLLVRKMRPTGKGAAAAKLPPDNWIYVQEPDVKLGRLQIFNNWSPFLVADPDTVWLGLEYFCNEGDGLWSMRDAAFLDFAAREIAQPDAVAGNALLIVQLDGPRERWLALISAAKTAGVPVLAFGRHTDADVRRELFGLWRHAELVTARRERHFDLERVVPVLSTRGDSYWKREQRGIFEVRRFEVEVRVHGARRNRFHDGTRE